MNAFVASARSPEQAAYYRLVNRFLLALTVLTAAWLVVLCLQGAVLIYDAPASVSTAAYWLSWVAYPPAALEVLVCAALLLLFRPRDVNRALKYAAPTRVQRARWLLYAIVITPLAVTSLA